MFLAYILKTISYDFKFKAKETGTVHGFGSWWDVKFSGEENVTLSTSPENP